VDEFIILGEGHDQMQEITPKNLSNPVGAPVFSVSEITALIKKQLESAFPKVQVKGEISNLKEQSSGHIYFTLKDAGAQLSAVLFKGSAAGLARPLKNGDQVVLTGELNVYAPRGSYQIVVRSIQFLGLGELLMQLHALKAKLESLGWFKPERKRPLPRFPRTIGVVTSPTGAVIQDIVHILERRLQGFHLVLCPVKVQGEGAAEDIASAIDLFNHYALADVLIVGRGGGNLEDLWAFNEEKVAAAIYRSKIPVISAVGHETDVCIADFVADIRAPTPSAAAEITSSETQKELHFLQQAALRLKSAVLAQLAHHKARQQQYKRHALFTRPFQLIEPHLQQLDILTADLDTSMHLFLQKNRLKVDSLKKQLDMLRPDMQIHTLKQRLKSVLNTLDRVMQNKIQLRQEALREESRSKHLDSMMRKLYTSHAQKLTQLTSHLAGIDPNNLLSKGYCILFREKTASVILSIQELCEGEKLRVKLRDGAALVSVNERHYE
jgi:exodeoxyribonuclease VII large subunit